MSIEAHALQGGFDCSAIQLVAREKPWNLIVEEETGNIPMAMEGDRQKPAEVKAAIESGEGKNYDVAEAKDYPVLIDFEKICLWDHDGDVKVGIRLEDPDYMKKRLLEWVHAVAAYVRFLHTYADIT
jgi:hypothetical protein